MTSPTATAEIERLAREATPGPWMITEYGEVRGPTGRTVEANGFASVMSPGAAQDKSRATAAYIAAVSPDVVLGILAALRAAEAERDAFRAALQPFVKFANLFGDTARDDDWVITHNPSGKNNLTMGDVRNARAALQSTSAKEGN